MRINLILGNIINYTLCCKITYIRPNYKLGLLGVCNYACACSKCVINGFKNPNGVIVCCLTNC